MKQKGKQIVYKFHYFLKIKYDFVTHFEDYSRATTYSKLNSG